MNDVLPNYNNLAPRLKYSIIKPELRVFNNELFDISLFKINQITSRPNELYNYNSNRPKDSYLEHGRTFNGGVKMGPVDCDVIIKKVLYTLREK